MIPNWGWALLRYSVIIKIPSPESHTTVTSVNYQKPVGSVSQRLKLTNPSHCMRFICAMPISYYHYINNAKKLNQGLSSSAAGDVTNSADNQRKGIELNYAKSKVQSDLGSKQQPSTRAPAHSSKVHGAGGHYFTRSRTNTLLTICWISVALMHLLVICLIFIALQFDFKLIFETDIRGASSVVLRFGKAPSKVAFLSSVLVGPQAVSDAPATRAATSSRLSLSGASNDQIKVSSNLRSRDSINGDFGVQSTISNRVMTREHWDHKTIGLSKMNNHGQAGMKTPPSNPSHGDPELKSTNIIDHRESIKTSASSSDQRLSTISNTVQIQKNIIIGIATNMDPMFFAVFCASLRGQTTSNEVDAVIFIDRTVGPRILEIAQRFSIQLLPIPETLLSSDAYKNYLGKSYHASTLRFILYRDFFASPATRQKYKYILMLDVRDTFFQLNPFDFKNKIAYNPATGSGEHLFVFEEPGYLIIDKCKWNSDWVRDCFGQEAWENVKHRSIICSGVILGSVNATVEYLNLIGDIIDGRQTDALIQHNLKPDIRRCERNGIDQGIHNIIVHNNLLPTISIVSQVDTYVANMQNMQSGDPLAFKMGIVKDSWRQSNGLYSIAHQYDRNFDLQEALMKKFVYWTNASDITTALKESHICQEEFEYAQDLDFFKGICDLKSFGGQSSPASCCQVCSGYPKCGAFTYHRGHCYLKHCDAEHPWNATSVWPPSMNYVDDRSTPRLAGAVSAMKKKM